MQIPGTKVKKNMTILLDNILYIVVDHQFNKPGKGAAFIRFKLKNFESGAVLEKNFRSDEKFEQVVIDEKEVEFLYRDGDMFHFMDQSTYDQIAIPVDHMGGNEKYLVDNMVVNAAYFQNKLLGVEVPLNVNLKVVQTEPGLKGDTVSGSSKPATLESGLVIQVPLFINEGEIITVNTVDDAYVGRA